MAQDMVSEREQEEERRSVEGLEDKVAAATAETDELSEAAGGVVRERVAPSPSGDCAGVTLAEKLLPFSMAAFVLLLPPVVSSANPTKLINTLMSSTRFKLQIILVDFSILFIQRVFGFTNGLGQFHA